MIKIGICDDEQIMAKEIGKYVREFFEQNNSEISIDTFISAKKFQSACRTIKYDLALLDVDMPEVSGFELAKEIQQNQKETVIVFISGRDLLVYESLKYQPFRFIRKSVCEEELKEALYSFYEKYLMMSKDTDLEFEEGVQIITITQVVFVESRGHIMEVNLSDGTLLHTKRHTVAIRDLEKRWYEYGFIRIERGYLVNYRYVKRIRGREMEMNDGIILSIGRSRVDDVKKRFLQLVRREDK